MLQSMGLQRVGHDLVTEQQQCLHSISIEEIFLVLQLKHTLLLYRGLVSILLIRFEKAGYSPVLWTPKYSSLLPW